MSLDKEKNEIKKIKWMCPECSGYEFEKSEPGTTTKSFPVDSHNIKMTDRVRCTNTKCGEETIYERGIQKIE